MVPRHFPLFRRKAELLLMLWLPLHLCGVPMNFVVVFTDELPPEYTGAYGGEAYPTPAIDALAQSGLRFDNGFSVSSICTPARFAVQTGRYPGRCQSPKFQRRISDEEDPYWVSWNTKITEQSKTLPKVLRDAGYITGIAGKWHLGAWHGRLPEIPEIQAGTDLRSAGVEEKLRARQEAAQRMVEATAGYTQARSVIPGNWEQEPLFNEHHNIPWITKGAIQLLRQFSEHEAPFFLMTTVTGIHGPWHAEALEADLRWTPGGWEADIYDYAPDYDNLRSALAGRTSGEKHKLAGMSELDHHVGLIVQELKDLGLYENTAIVFTADHGIEPGKASVYDRGVRVPLIVRWPGATDGQSTLALAQHTDISATIALEAGLEEAAAEMDGFDLRPLFSDPNAQVRDYAWFECGYTRGITDGHYKYIAIRLPEWLIAKAGSGEMRWLTVGMGSETGAHAAFSQLAYPGYYDADQLYDLQSDPYELVNLWSHSEYAASRARLAKALQRQARTFDQPFPAPAQPFFASETYRILTERTRRENNPHERESWVKRDHDHISWPPAEKRE
jgi:arylsulfatase A-like enzyme